MAKGNAVQPRGTTAEQQVFKEVHGHYVTAKEDLDQRIHRKNGFDDMDKLVASYIDEANWPYRSVLFDARPFTAITEKTARLIGRKPKGRMAPREGTDDLGAYINNELINYQWDENSKLGQSMIEKWMLMDQNARKYGSSFAIVTWRYQTKVDTMSDKPKRQTWFDCPTMEVCNARDVLANPSYSFINKWFQYRSYSTVDELENINDAARSKPVYKNLDILRTSLKEEAKSKGGDKRETNYVSKNKHMKGLTDYLGSDEVYKTIELVTEYRPNRWITIAPRYGVVIRDIPNPYKHGEIPVVQLKYYPLMDDLYGVAELEPVASQLKGVNAHLSAFSDTIALSLRPPIHVNPINVRMHTLEFIPEAKWLMNNPGTDVVPHQFNAQTTNNFQAVYSTMVSSALNALGETSQGISNIDPTQSDKTATEVRDSAFTRNVRDNMNQIFLAEALKKQVLFWQSMNQQLLFSGNTGKVKVIRIVGREAIKYFKRQGLSDIRPTEADAEQAALGMLDINQIAPGPRYAVEYGDQIVPKLEPDDSGQSANLYIEQGDLGGLYDYIPDVESMQAPSQQAVEQKLTAILGVLTNPTVLQMLQGEGKKPKVSELLIKMFESTNVIKDAESYFEDVQQMLPGMDVQNQALPGGGAPAAAGVPNQGMAAAPGMGGNSQTVPGGQNTQLMGRPAFV